MFRMKQMMKFWGKKVEPKSMPWKAEAHVVEGA